MDEINQPILVVEDIPHIRELLEVTLQFKGYPVLSAQNGEEALDLINDGTPSLVIADILMPQLGSHYMATVYRNCYGTRHSALGAR